MRILFDQNVPRALRNLLPGHAVRTAAEMGWSTLANGYLVDAAERAGFEAIITADRNFRFHVDISSRGLAVIILSTNHWPTLQRGAAGILRALQGVRSGSYQDVAVGRFRRSIGFSAETLKHGLQFIATRKGVEEGRPAFFDRNARSREGIRVSKTCPARAMTKSKKRKLPGPSCV